MSFKQINEFTFNAPINTQSISDSFHSLDEAIHYPPSPQLRPQPAPQIEIEEMILPNSFNSGIFQTNQNIFEPLQNHSQNEIRFDEILLLFSKLLQSNKMNEE